MIAALKVMFELHDIDCIGKNVSDCMIDLIIELISLIAIIHP